MAFENYIKAYIGYLEEVRKETYKKYKDETEMLFEFIDNWIDLIPRAKINFSQLTNSLSGIILLNSWKLTNWISYEILNGKYFEAIRNLRFLFEGSVYAVIIEDAIESKVFTTWGSLSKLDLKAEIFQIWEECKKRKVFRKRKINKDKIRRLVSDFVNRNIDPSKRKDAEEYIGLYVEILSNKKLYLSTSRMIKECASYLKLDEKDIKKVRRLWHELSKYLHFSYPYLETIIEDPGFSFLEGLNDDLFTLSINFYFRTLDFFYTVLVWRFETLRKEIKTLCEWWKNNFNKTFCLTEKILNIVGE